MKPYWPDTVFKRHVLPAAARARIVKKIGWHSFRVRCGGLPKNTSQTNGHFVLPNKYLVSPTAKKGLHGGGCGPHPRGETKGLSQAVSGLLQPESLAPRCAEPQLRVRVKQEKFEPNYQFGPLQTPRVSSPSKPWSRIEQGLRTADLLLQGGGFSAVVRHGQPLPGVRFKSASGNVVPLSCGCGANPVQHPSTDATCMREEQRRTLTSASTMHPYLRRSYGILRD
jgi:hypothetical protein